MNFFELICTISTNVSELSRMKTISRDQNFVFENLFEIRIQLKVWDVFGAVRAVRIR